MTRIVFISDVHVGSNYAVFPESWTIPESQNVIEANPWQKQLYKKWVELAEKLSPVDVICLLGDLVEGPQTKEKVNTLTLVDVKHQADCFIELFREHWQWKKLFVVRGSGYHVEVQGLHVEEYIAQQLKAEEKDGRRSFYDIPIEINGKRIHLAHHVGYSSIPHYRFTPLVRQGWVYKMFDDYHGKYDVVVRGHVHYHLFAEISNFLVLFTCPCWQNPTPYQKKHDPFFVPDIGLVELEITDNGDLIFRKYISYPPRPRAFNPVMVVKP